MNFELRYIHPVWTNKDQVSYIDVSPNTIEITEIENHSFSANTLAYIRINENEDAYIGIKLLADITDNPYVEKADGTKEDLKKVKLSEKEVWWIIANSWSNADKEYRTQAFNRMGEITVKIGADHLLLTNEANNFTYEDLAYILNDFKSSLWQIIADPRSIASANIEQRIPIFSASQSIEDLEKFLIHIEKMLKNPEKKIIETTDIQYKEKAKIVKATLLDLLKNPYEKKVSSRSFTESFDTPANKYLHFCISRIVYILTIYKKISSSRQNFIKGTLEKLEKQKIKYIDEDYKTLQKEVFRNQIDMVEGQYKELTFALCDIRDNNHNKDNQQTFRITYAKDSQLSFSNFTNNNQLPFSTKLSENEWHSCKNRFFIQLHQKDKEEYKYQAIDLPPNWVKKLKDAPPLWMNQVNYLTFTVTATITYSMYKEKGRILKLHNITNVSIENDDNLAKLKGAYKTQTAMDDTQESESLSIERSVSKDNLKKLHEFTEYLDNTDKKIDPLLKKAQGLQRKFEKKGIGIQNSFPQSIMFVTNHLYSTPYKYFKKLSENLGISEKQIGQIEKINKIGLIKICEIYEFWCLISIIKVLVVKLGFKPDDDWASKLIGAVLSRGKDSSVSFSFSYPEYTLWHNNISGLTFTQNPIILCLTYQKRLPSGKRPDFVLEFEGNKYSKLILDAKFRGDVTQETIKKDINDMFEVRKYKDYGDVFILHTSCKAMYDKSGSFKSLSPLSWGRFSSYGGENQLNHTKGHIFFLPSPRYPSSMDNLQRLIGAFLQQNSLLDWEYNDDRPIITKMANILCIGCGSSNIDISLGKTQGNNERATIICKKCGLKSERTVCFNCHRDKLYKNGPWWTYHMTKATQVSNVVCPQCGAYF